jgi:hypothetical protein
VLVQVLQELALQELALQELALQELELLAQALVHVLLALEEEELLPFSSQHKLQGLLHKQQTKPLNKIVSLFIPLSFELPDTLSIYSYT